MGGRVTFAPVSDNQLSAYRRWFFVGWILALGVLPWILWWNPGGQAEFQFQMFSVRTLITLTIVSVVLGWSLGYKLLIAPLFCGMVIKHK